MARGSRTSRAERRTQKERAVSALERGLPVATPPSKRVAVGASSPARPTSHAPVPSAPGASQPIPMAVKLLGLGLGLLALVYGLTLFRDHKSVPGPAAAPAHSIGAVK